MSHLNLDTENEKMFSYVDQIIRRRRLLPEVKEITPEVLSMLQDDSSSDKADTLGHFYKFLYHLPAGSVVLDFGCGIGLKAMTMATKHPQLRIICYDPYIDPNRRLKRDNMTWVDSLCAIKHSTVSLVTMSYVTHHMNGIEMIRMTSEIKRILTLNGRVVIKEHSVGNYIMDMKAGAYPKLRKDPVHKTARPVDVITWIHNMWGDTDDPSDCCSEGLMGKLYFRSPEKISRIFGMKHRIVKGNSRLFAVYIVLRP